MINESFANFEAHVMANGGWDRVTNIWFNNSIVMTFNIYAKDAAPGKPFNKDTEPELIIFDPAINYDKTTDCFKWYTRDVRGYPQLATRSLHIVEGVDFLPPDGKLIETDIRATRP